MEQLGEYKRFSLLGGPLHGVGRRLGLVRGVSTTVPLGLVLGLGCWAVMLALALIEGFGRGLFSLVALPAHVSLLIAIPSFFVCEAWVDPRMATFVHTIVRSGVVPEDTLPALDRVTAQVLRWRDSWIPEALCLALAALWSMSGSAPALEGARAVFDVGHTGAAIPLAGRWYCFVCLPLFHFLILRWLWRLGLWSHFLWRMSRLELHLLPTHPDGLAGLGYLEVVNKHFMPLILSLSAVQAAAFAGEMSAGIVTFDAIYPTLAMVLIVDIVLFMCPTFVFTPKLWACKVKGLSDYMEFASVYVTGFDKKWVRTGAPPDERLLGTSDIQSLADLGNSLNAVKGMRVVPIELGLFVELVVVALLPALPLALFKYSIPELAEKFFTRLSGM
jgi:hypothetical protein